MEEIEMDVATIIELVKQLGIGVAALVGGGFAVWYLVKALVAQLKDHSNEWKKIANEHLSTIGKSTEGLCRCMEKLEETQGRLTTLSEKQNECLADIKRDIRDVKCRYPGQASQ